MLPQITRIYLDFYLDFSLMILCDLRILCDFFSRITDFHTSIPIIRAIRG